MRRIQIQKKKSSRDKVGAHLSGRWQPVMDLKTQPATTPLTNAQREELQQRHRLQALIREHAVA